MKGGMARGRTRAIERKRRPGKWKFSTNQAAGTPRMKASEQDPMMRIRVSLMASSRRYSWSCCQASAAFGVRGVKREARRTMTGESKRRPRAHARICQRERSHPPESCECLFF